MKTCVVTGANGVVGSACVKAFERKGYQVVRFQRHPQPAGAARFVLGDPVDPTSFRGVDTLVHCAYDFKVHGWKAIARINVGGSAQLFQAAHTAGVRKLIFISSASAYEGCPSLYGQAKIQTEALVRTLGGVSIRPGLVWGDIPNGVFASLRRIARLPILPVFAGGRQHQYLVHIDDLAEIVVAVARGEGNEAAGAPLMVAHPQPVEFQALLRGLAAHRGKKVRLISVPGRLALWGLSALEAAGVQAGFRSDSLLGLLHPNPHPDFAPMNHLNLSVRHF